MSRKAERVVQPQHLYCFIQIMNRLNPKYRNVFYKTLADSMFIYKNAKIISPFLERVARIIRNTGITMQIEDIIRVYLSDPHESLFDFEEMKSICDELDRLMLELILDVSTLSEIKEKIL